MSDFNMQMKFLLKIQQNQRLQLTKCICKEIKANLASELSFNDLPVILHSTKSQKIIFLDQLHFKEESLNIHFFSQQLSICKQKKIEFLGFTGSFAVQKICKRLQNWTCTSQSHYILAEDSLVDILCLLGRIPRKQS